MRSLAQQLKTKYISENLERSVIVDYTQAGAKTYLYKDLPYTEVEGYPFAADFISDTGVTYGMGEWASVPESEKAHCQLRFHYMPFCHEIYLGCTGSGKTTGCIEPQLRAISSQKNKPNLFITDPKGELFDHNAEHLKENGYHLFVLNFKDSVRSDRWNPLLELYDTKMRGKKIGAGVKKIVGSLPPAKLELVSPPSEYDPQRGYVAYDGKAFSCLTDANIYIEIQEDALAAEIDQLINEIVHTMIKVTNNNDRTWEEGAQELLKGLLILMCDLAVEDPNFTREMMNMQTLHSYYTSLRNFSYDGDRSGKLDAHNLFRDNRHEKAFNLMATALNTAPRTMRGYCSVFESAMKDWFQANIYALTTNQTINLEECGDEPYAVFLITRDYEKSDFQIAGLFIDWVYRLVLKQNEEDPTRRPLHFLLDEFGNIPRISDFENKIATARSRNIWFHLVLQSYSQLDVIYKDHISEVIVDNCNSLIFLGSQNADTKRKFSEQCGKHFIENFTLKDDADIHLIEVPIVPLSTLDEMVPGQLYIKRFRCPVIKAEFIRSYICAQEGYFPHFRESNGIEKCAPFTLLSYGNERFIHRLPAGGRNNSPFGY